MSLSSSLLFALCLLGLTSAALTVGPRNTVVVRGDSAQLRCQTTSNSSSSAPTWKFTGVDGEHQEFVYNDAGLNPDYRKRNVTVRNGTLHFHAVQLRDAGTYTCQDDGGIGEPLAAWLAVLDGEPVCVETVTSSGVTMVTCNVTVNASNIHKPLEALEVRPVIVNHTAAGNDTVPCSESSWSADVVDSSSESTQSRLFVLVVNVTGLATGTCSAPSLTLHATTLSGKLVSTIKDRPPEYKLLLPISSQDDPTKNPPTTTSAAEGITSSIFSNATDASMPSSGDVVIRTSTQQILLSLTLLLWTCLVNQRL